MSPNIQIRGLRWCDPPVLCPVCAKRILSPAPLVGWIGDGDEALAVVGGMPTCAALVELVSAWKYRGRRGLVRPLGELTSAAWARAVATAGVVDRLVPVPLHGRRRRERGFNQAELLANVLTAKHEVPVATDLVKRVRATAQQAKLASDKTIRARNVRGVFDARAPRAGEPARLGLIDDLVTSGATAGAVAAVLREAGWSVSWVLAAGLAADRGALDSGHRSI